MIALIGETILICNAGNSRVVLGHCVKENEEGVSVYKEGVTMEEEKREIESLKAPSPLETANDFLQSRFHTPKREDERDRVKGHGTEVISIKQKEGETVMHEHWINDFNDESCVVFDEDVPRIWFADKQYPGCAFTRSLGCENFETLRITADPEMMTKKLTKNDEILIIATHGLFKYMTNGAAVAIATSCATPIENSEKLVNAAFAEWITYGEIIQDITVIVCFLKKTLLTIKQQHEGKKRGPCKKKSRFLAHVHSKVNLEWVLYSDINSLLSLRRNGVENFGSWTKVVMI